jgi:acyl-CoA dehydrogenase
MPIKEAEPQFRGAIICISVQTVANRSGGPFVAWFAATGRQGYLPPSRKTVLNDMRIAEGARYLAAAEKAFALTLEYVKNRSAFGQRIFDFQNTQFRLAEMKTELCVGRAFLEKMLRKIQAATVSPTDSSMTKLWLSELEFRVADQCLQFFGGMGYAHEMPIPRIWTHARVHRILLGTSEIDRVAIGRSL